MIMSFEILDRTTLVFDPDQQVQHCLRWLFETFRRTGSTMATARAARHQDLAFARRSACAWAR
jgi:hypothetical protein